MTASPLEARWCDACHDTGSLSKQSDGHLDCHYCEATEKRRKLRKHIAQFAAWPDNDTVAWAAYLFAQRQAAPVAAQPEEIEQLKARLEAKEMRNKMLLAELDALSARYFHDGVPPAHFGKEWFIAVMEDGDKVVLRALDEESAYDYTTMDATYFKAYRVKKWMQFPDSDYITYDGSAPQPAAQPSDDVALKAAVERMQKAHAAANVPAKLPAYDEAFEYQAAVHALIKAAVAQEKT